MGLTLKSGLAYFSSAALLWMMMAGGFYAFGHGEDKPGPHGGHIRMPGAFHTELVLSQDRTFKVYILDLNLENPSVKAASVTATVQYESGVVMASCAAKAKFFLCELPKKFSKEKTLKNANEITLESVLDPMANETPRRGKSVYTFPLRFKASKVPRDSGGHGKHHGH